MNRIILKILILITFILSFGFASGQNYDINLLRKINLDGNSSIDGLFKGLSNSAAPITIGTPIVLLGIGIINQDSIATRKALYIGTSVLVSTGITLILKYSINRPRPYTTYPDIEKEGSGKSPSFPSGHTSDAFSFATSLSLAYPKWYIIAPSFLWAGAVGYSRMDLGVHYPSDVLIGAIIGAGSAFLCYKLNKKLKAQRF